MTKQVLIGLSLIALMGCHGGDPQRSSANIESQAGYFGEQYSKSDSVSAQDGRTNFESVQERVRVSPASVNLDTTSPTNPTDGADPAGVYLAYRYGYGLVMPSKSVQATTNKHIQICRDAGPSKCQITGSNTNSYSDEDIRANLSLRAEPEWLKSFITSMKSDIAKIDGRIESENTSVEDLTRSILDTDARLKAQTTLRTRLETLLETRDAKLPDLLALERELARVQGEIESATANLRALRTRVSMSVVNLSYTSERAAVSRSSVAPIGAALRDFVRTVSFGLAGVIHFFAFMLPWTIFIIIPGGFLIRWFWRRRKKAKIET